MQYLEKRPLCKISIQDLLERISTTLQRERSHNAQSDEGGGRVISKLAPRHYANHLTRTKWWEGCADEHHATTKLSSHAQNDDIWCRERHENEHRSTTRTIWHAQNDERVVRAHVTVAKCCVHQEKWQLETWKRCFTWGSLEYRTCHQKWAWGIWSLAPATQMIIILVMYQIVSCTLLPNETTRLSSLSKHDPTVQLHLILRLPQKPPLVATRACQSFSNVHEIPRLPRGWKGVWCLAPATQSEVRTSGEKWPGKRNVVSPKHDGRRQARTHLRKRCLEANVSWKVCFKNGRSRNFSPCKGRHQIN